MEGTSRFIGLARQRRSAEDGVELLPAAIEAVLVGEDDYDDVHTGNDPILGQAPALGNHAARPVPSDRVAVFPNGNENGAGFRAAVRPDIEAEALAGPSRPLVEYLGYLASRTDSLGFPESEPLSAPFVVRHGNQYFFFSSDVLSLARPLARRLLRTAWPPFVFIRALNPNFLTRRVLLG